MCFIFLVFLGLVRVVSSWNIVKYRRNYILVNGWWMNEWYKLLEKSFIIYFIVLLEGIGLYIS